MMPQGTHASTDRHTREHRQTHTHTHTHTFGLNLNNTLALSFSPPSVFALQSTPG